MLVKKAYMGLIAAGVKINPSVQAGQAFVRIALPLVVVPFLPEK